MHSESVLSTVSSICNVLHMHILLTVFKKRALSDMKVSVIKNAEKRELSE